MLVVGNTYPYIYNGTSAGSPVTIERIADGIAYATSGKFADLGPFTMTFEVQTGRGLGGYKGTRLEL